MIDDLISKKRLTMDEVKTVIGTILKKELHYEINLQLTNNNNKIDLSYSFAKDENGLKKECILVNEYAINNLLDTFDTKKVLFITIKSTVHEITHILQYRNRSNDLNNQFNFTIYDVIYQNGLNHNFDYYHKNSNFLFFEIDAEIMSANYLLNLMNNQEFKFLDTPDNNQELKNQLFRNNYRRLVNFQSFYHTNLRFYETAVIDELIFIASENQNAFKGTILEKYFKKDLPLVDIVLDYAETNVDFLWYLIMYLIEENFLEKPNIIEQIKSLESSKLTIFNNTLSKIYNQEKSILNGIIVGRDTAISLEDENNRLTFSANIDSNVNYRKNRMALLEKYLNKYI